ncbi:MAG: hypothetical protein A2201_01450 [Alicyclobacillus sp. RIFOXYA1_FULL_53_8]|nr:MAG: hypothetical protein A2201_01450 [Alicyclobacillus sp. RIFOXYA1_FULL_53_8]
MERHYVETTAKLGRGCTLGVHAVIHADVVLGDDVQIGDNVVILKGTEVGDRVVVGANSVLGKQPMSNRRVKRKARDVGPLKIQSDVSIGAGVVLYAGTSIATGVLIGDQASVREHVDIGEDSVIGRAVTVELNTHIGQRVVLQTGSYITGDSVIEDDVFVGPEVSTSNDKYMGLKPFVYQGPHIETKARVGNNATLLPGVRIGAESIVGAGAVVTKDVAPNDVVVGNPAHSIRTASGSGES